MSYATRFVATDNLIAHLSPIVSTITDTSLKANYAGFISVSAVTVYELAIKDLFYDFAKKKNPVFGSFVEKHFKKINGKITLDDLKKQHIDLFGKKYQEKFDKKLKKREAVVLSRDRMNVRSCYSNLVLCRHKFVHGGSPTLTFEEAIKNYYAGKEIIYSLEEAMKR